MNWELLLLLACPLMMLLCMKGMFGGSKDKDAKAKANQPQVSPSEMQSLQMKMAEMMEQNQKLMNELQSMKESQSVKASQPEEQVHSNVVEMKEEARAKKVVS
jgi:uncharacterized protein (DUF3084 family)